MAITSVRFTSQTGSDDKDHDTGVFVRVFTQNQQTLIASVDNADNCDSCHYDDHTTHSFNLIVNSPGLSKAQCTGFVYKVGSRANGNDNWDIDSTSIDIVFDDGSDLQKASGGFSLNSRGSALVWAGPF
jgi:hypothetical protein